LKLFPIKVTNLQIVFGQSECVEQKLGSILVNDSLENESAFIGIPNTLANVVNHHNGYGNEQHKHKSKKSRHDGSITVSLFFLLGPNRFEIYGGTASE
jgi:hypothetical protein